MKLQCKFCQEQHPIEQGKVSAYMGEKSFLCWCFCTWCKDKLINLTGNRLRKWCFCSKDENLLHWWRWCSGSRSLGRWKVKKIKWRAALHGSIEIAKERPNFEKKNAPNKNLGQKTIVERSSTKQQDFGPGKKYSCGGLMERKTNFPIRINV